MAGVDLTPASVRGGQTPGPMLDDGQGGSYAVEAALFRPALQDAMREVSKWKANSLRDTMASLPPLPPISATHGPDQDNLAQLSAAVSSFRLEAASSMLVDLSRQDISPRQQLINLQRRNRAASARLEAAILNSRLRSAS